MQKYFIKKEKRFWTNLVSSLMGQVFFLCAFIAVVSLLLITVYVFYNGLQLFKVVHLSDFLFGDAWEPVTQKLFGILPMIISSFYVTFGALIISIPLGIGCAVFLAEIASPLSLQIIRPAVHLLAGIPSVVYGLFGLALVVPMIQNMAGVAGLS